MEWIGEKKEERSVGIRVSDACNFSCRYCNEHNTIKKKYITFEEYILIIEKVKLLYFIENKPIRILLWGGEPLLNKDLKKIIEYTLKQPFIYKINIHSNFSIRTDEVLNMIIENKIECYSSIHLDYFFNPKIKENFIYNLDKLLEFGLITEINLMLQDLKEFEKCKDIKKELKRYPINIAPVTQLFNMNKKQIKMLLSITGEYLSKEINTSEGYKNYMDIYDIDHRGYICNTSLNNLIINTNGDVLSCQNSIFAKHKHNHGNIYEYEKEDFEVFLKPIECIHKTCVCGHFVYKEREKLKPIESKYTHSIFTEFHKLREK